MTIIGTVSGREINFMVPDPDQISLDDLAAGLSQHPRYTGQTIRPYTVAQHSILVAELAPPEHRLHALLHDAPEAYLCDVPSPAKEAMRVIAMQGGFPSAYDVLEGTLWKAICQRFDISPTVPLEVQRADRGAMLIEAPRLQPKGWRLPHWDFIRLEPAPEIAEWLVQGIFSLQHGGRHAWMTAIATELAHR